MARRKNFALALVAAAVVASSVLAACDAVIGIGDYHDRADDGGDAGAANDGASSADGAAPNGDGSSADAQTDGAATDGSALDGEVDGATAMAGPFLWDAIQNSVSTVDAIVAGQSGEVILGLTAPGPNNFTMVQPDGGILDLGMIQGAGVVVKLDAVTHKVLWATSFGGNGANVHIEALAMIGNGSIVVAGETKGQLSFGTSTIPSAANYNGFVGQIQKNGTLGPALSVSTSTNDYSDCTALSVDAANNTLLGCKYTGAVQLPGRAGSFTATLPDGGGGATTDVAVFYVAGPFNSNSSGWGVSFGGTGNETIESVAPTPGANTAYFSGTFASDAIGLQSVNLTRTAGSNADEYLLSFDTMTKTAGIGKNWGANTATALNAYHVVRPDGLVLLATNFQTAFDPGLGAIEGGGFALFAFDPVTKLTTWQRGFTASTGGAAFVTGIAASAAGDVSAVGSFSNNLTLGGAVVDAAPPPFNAGGWAAKFGDGGTTTWAYSIASPIVSKSFGATAVSVAVDGGNTVYTGGLPDTVDLGNGVLTGPAPRSPADVSNYVVERGP
jgi:hypothetical protein